MDQFKVYAIQRVVIGVLFAVVAIWAITFAFGLLSEPKDARLATAAGDLDTAHDAGDHAAATVADPHSSAKKAQPHAASLHATAAETVARPSGDTHSANTRSGDTQAADTGSHQTPSAVDRAAQHRATPSIVGGHGSAPAVRPIKQAPGVALTQALIKPLEYELENRWWGWRPNDVINVTDNVTNFQLGVLEVTRRATVVLAERISRTGASDSFNHNLENAMNWFMIKPDDYWFPSPETKYAESLNELRSYAQMLKQRKASFYTRTDNLIPLLLVFQDLMGSCEENLVKTHEKGGEKVSHFKADDYFFYAKGVASAMGTILEAVGEDFEQILEARHGMELLHHTIEGCQHALHIKPLYITNADLSGILANHRANLAAPISHVRFQLGVLIKTLST